MASYTVPPLYAAFIWWFSTGAVLLLVGRASRFGLLGIAIAAASVAVSLWGLSASAGQSSVTGAYVAFTCTILLWGAQEIAFLAGWLTGPRALACPAGVTGWRRFWLALQAILYHELALLTCGGAILALTWHAPNQVGLWTFGSLWGLRQSAKINLFLGVPVTNDELMPDAVRFLKTFFLRQPVSCFFPASVTLATAVMVILIQRIVEVAATPADIASLMLVTTLFALGVLEHWFMLLPMPALTLWGWGIPVFPPEDTPMEQGPIVSSKAVISSRHDEDEASQPVSSPESRAAVSPVVVLSNLRVDTAPAKLRHDCARQRLEDQFRQRFIEQRSGDHLANALKIGAEPAPAINGRTS